ncbi:hypothetical protein [Caulobacter rhizosphaerae]|uniref:hypothetical protein n=1 Tax=Caulobacter rhizosphaerae TaxID=2010972 RepID=UPI0013D39B4F|nr:hypothetical protein [Caulobacter rhizosphaerae]GGL35526.1 hypothetical protein GCM10010983_35630 [Caulobacter rhizosphaerae]
MIISVLTDREPTTAGAFARRLAHPPQWDLGFIAGLLREAEGVARTGRREGRPASDLIKTAVQDPNVRDMLSSALAALRTSEDMVRQAIVAGSKTIGLD